MKRKEGRMDSPMSYPLSYVEKKAIKDYEAGWRAYENFDGLAVYFKDGVYHNTPISLQKLAWSALRAYQDEQRKKGVPIVFPDWGAENSWLSRDHGEIGVYRSSFAIRQEWDQTKRPRIYAFDREHCSGMFTNFRWREGYPKEKHKVRIGPDYLSVIYPPFDLTQK
jgi:hypothetical protein